MQTLAHKQLDTLANEDLMERFQNGCEDSFKLLVTRFKDRLHNFLYRYTHNHQDCEDLAQETFIRVYTKRDSYERIAKFSTWMYTIALNLARSHYKKKKRKTKVSIHEDESDPDDHKMNLEDTHILPDAELHEKMCMDELEKVLPQLNENFREVVLLRDIQQLSYEEVADITELPMGTVKSRINRGRAQLQNLLEGYV